MKKKFLLILLFAISISYSFIYKTENSLPNSLVLQFVTHNGYGNNLYIDNVTVGLQYDRDIKITSFINMPSDTIYALGVQNYNIHEVQAFVTNVGKTTISSARFVLNIPEIPYSDTMTIPALGPKNIQLLTFDSVSFPVNATYHPILYLADTVDGNPSNDTLRQSFGYYVGFPKKILFEEFTSATSSSSAVNNPSLNNFVNSKFDSIVAIKYHVGFPAPGNDSLYLADTIQSKEKQDYYDIVAVPTLIFNGSMFSGYPFSTENLQVYFDTLKKLGSPLRINVTDTRLAGDTISSDITINIISPIRSGNYFLKVNAVERQITYSSPPGTNGESVFYDVFRQSIPGTQGISIPTAAGTYNYYFKYKRNPVWVDSMLYTVAFVQDDYTFEVLNSAKSRSGVYEALDNFTINNSSRDFISDKYKHSQNKDFSKLSYPKLHNRSAADTASTNFYLEQFETPGIPQNWTLAHLSELITFGNVYNSGINGISYPGNGCMRMNFYANTNLGQMDTLYSPVISGVTSLDILRFDYSYAGYLFNEGDSLYVNLSTDGGLTFPTNIFAKGGIGLATSSTSTISYVPTLPTQWRTFEQSLYGIVQDNYSIPVAKDFQLNQNYPNPFNPSTKISFNLPVSSIISLIVYDISGREVKRLVDETMTAGLHEVNFDGAFLSSGVYFYKLSTPGFTQSKKMVLIK